MNGFRDEFEGLRSEEVFADGSLASDVLSLRRRLGSLPQVAAVSLALSSDPERIKGLCRFVTRIIERDYDKRFRHPEDIGVCAALLLLEQSPLSEARNLMDRLKGCRELSLVWVQRMAEDCDRRYTGLTYASQPVTHNQNLALEEPDAPPDVRWSARRPTGLLEVA